MNIGNAHFKYAEALIRTAKKLNAGDAVLADLKGLSELFKDADFKLRIKEISFLKKELLEKLLRGMFEGKVNRITMNLLIMLGRAKKIHIIPLIQTVYSRYHFEGKGIEQLTIRTARKLNAEEEGRLAERLIQRKDKMVNIEFEIDSKLIGGAQVLQKGYLTDYSVKNYLETLKKQLISH